MDSKIPGVLWTALITGAIAALRYLTGEIAGLGVPWEESAVMVIMAAIKALEVYGGDPSEGGTTRALLYDGKDTSTGVSKARKLLFG